MRNQKKSGLIRQIARTSKPFSGYCLPRRMRSSSIRLIVTRSDGCSKSGHRTNEQLGLRLRGTLRKRVTIISVEKERVIEIRWQGRNRESGCEQCGTQTRLLTPGEAALVAGVSSSLICDWVETGRVHFTKTSEGLLLVCLNSLGRLLNGRV